MDYTKPREQATEVTTSNLLLDDQISLNVEQRNTDIQTEQSTTENDRTQDTATPTGTYFTQQ